MRGLLVLAGLALVLGGCARPARDTPAQVVVLPAVYCYHTLGDADCYEVPLDSEVRRLVNYYGPTPAVRGFSGR
jgi:hypothetical protein